MIIAGYIFSVAYVSLRQSSLILVDAWQSPKVTELVKRIIEQKFGYEQVGIRSVLLRSAGMITQASLCQGFPILGIFLIRDIQKIISAILRDIKVIKL